MSLLRHSRPLADGGPERREKLHRQSAGVGAPRWRPEKDMRKAA